MASFAAMKMGNGMSEFSSLTTKFVTPLLRQRGFKKHGKFENSPTHDSAIYRCGDIELVITYAFHPYDYPDIGIRMQVREGSKLIFDRLHPPTDGGIETMLQAIVSDIKSDLAGV